MGYDFKEKERFEGVGIFRALASETISKIRRLPSNLKVISSYLNTTIDLLTLKVAINELKINKPNDPSIAKGVLIKGDTSAKGTEVIFAYWDKKNTPVERSTESDSYEPYGFVKTVKAFDSEMVDLFGEDDYVVIECFNKKKS